MGAAGMCVLVITASQSVPMFNNIPTFGAISAAAIGTSAAAGGGMGGVKGYHEAEGAGTPWKAAKCAAETIKNEAQTVRSKAKDRMSQAKKSCNP